MGELNEIAAKWQKRWEDSKLFESNPDGREKFFLTFPYPYINSYQHIGHLFTLMRVESFARYKRLRGYNVLFPQGWHATGSPILNAAKRVQQKEAKQIKILQGQGFSDEDIRKFEMPEYWIEFFAPEYEKDYKRMGMSVDWRRKFFTTSLNPHYDRFIRWQFLKLKQKGYVIKGKFPVVWDPKEEFAVGDHARVEGEGVVPQEFCLFKFRLDDGPYIITATLRPDTLLGITNLYVNPKEVYKEVETLSERWIVAKPMISKMEFQDFNVKVVRDIPGASLVGKLVKSYSGNLIPVLPATFLDSNYGTGMVHSVPSESADDLIALRDLQADDEKLGKYGLDKDIVKSIKPIPIFSTPGISGMAAEYFLNKYNVKSQNEREKLEAIKKELYTLTLNKSRFNEKYEKGFKVNLSGMPVREGQEIIKKELLNDKKIHIFYELTGKVVSRSLAECVVKIVDDQWFINYNNPEWKKLAHECIASMNFYPGKARQQFEYCIDWLHEWACTHHEGLGTRLPWDEKWVIESLSDSTIYMAYYTISHLITKIEPERLDECFFDYLFLDEGQMPKGIDAGLMAEMKKNFSYFYPVDFRNSGKDLIQNHLSFFIFNHAAVFPKKHWPRAIGVNGWVTVDGQKMSKSLGNMIPVRDMAEKFSPDASRITILNGGEELDDPNWDTEFAKSVSGKLIALKDLYVSNYNKHAVAGKRHIDLWLESELNSIIKKATEACELTNFRTAIQLIFFDMQNAFRHYISRSGNNLNKEVTDRFIESSLVMLSPFTPHICEEVWEAIGKRGFVSAAKWPEYDESRISEKIIKEEAMVEKTTSDIRSILKLVKERPKKVYLYSIPPEKAILAENNDAFAIEGMECTVYAINDKGIYDPHAKASKAKPGKPAIYLE